MRVRKSTIVGATLTVCMAAMSLSHTLQATFPTFLRDGKLRYAVVVMCFLALLSLNLRGLWHFPKASMPTLAVWFLLCATMIVSSLANGEIPYDGTWMLVGVPATYFSAFPRLIRGREDLIASSLAISYLLYLIQSIALFPLSYPYNGVFAGPNALGMASAGVAAGCFVMLARDRISIAARLCILGTLILSCILTVFSGSRTSQIAFLVMAFLWVVDRLKRKRVVAAVALSGSAIAIAWLAISLLAPLFPSGVFAKWSIERHQYYLSGRVGIWGKTLEDASLLGHGSRYFEESFGLGPHNIFVGVIGRYGVIAGALTVIFCVLTIVAAFRYHNSASFSRGSLGPLIICCGFWVLNMAEDLFSSLGPGITCAFMLSIGVLVQSPGVRGGRIQPTHRGGLKDPL